VQIVVNMVAMVNMEILAMVGHGDWGWGNDYSHHHWWHGQYYPNCDWVWDPYSQQWVWNC
jgi:hypothetical protein